MKISPFFLLFITSLATFACQRPANLRDGDSNLARLKELAAREEILFDMFNYAIAWDDVEALEILSSRGGPTKYVDQILHQTDRPIRQTLILLKPLHLAAQYGSLQVIAFCLAHKANINERTHCEDKEHHDQTPAHWAMIYSQHSALSKLLERGADISLKDAMGRTVENIMEQKEDITAYGIIQEHKARIAKQ